MNGSAGRGVAGGGSEEQRPIEGGMVCLQALCSSWCLPWKGDHPSGYMHHVTWGWKGPGARLRDRWGCCILFDIDMV